MRIYLSAIAVIFISVLASCSGSKPVDDRFSFRPPADTIFHFTFLITDSSGRVEPETQLIQFSLQKMGEKDSISTMKLVIGRLRITEPGITMAESKKGSIVVMAAGTMVTLSTDTSENQTTGSDAGYYDAWTRILPLLRDQSLQVEMNNQGEALQVTGFDTIAQKISAATAIDRRTVRQLLYDYASDESIRDLLNQVFFFLPGRKIEKGDTWVKNVTLTAHAPVKTSHLIFASYVNREDDAIVVEVQSVVSAKTGEEGRLYADGEVTGKIAASHITGMPYDMKLTRLVTTHTDQQDIVRKRVISMVRN
jgi:hypothetical protein